MKPTDPQFKLRLPTDLKGRLEAAAAASGKSLSAEIVARLESTFSEADKLVAREQEKVQIARELLAELRAELVTELARSASKKKP